ncbi:MAG: apolipoprotein N-acyltransferase [Rubrimonas sp.]|uniref:apolipoprotein N-acyltransferase n=1 Tax=Rubrimonas sp. TaxID=2036015 RepID=UPI002FDEF7AC
MGPSPVGWLAARAAHWPVRGRAALAAASGLALTLAQPPYGIWPALFLAWPALLGLVASSPSPRRAALIGWVAGFAQFLSGLHWIGAAFLVEAGKVWWYGPVMPVAIAALAAVLGAFWAAAFWLARRLGAQADWRGAMALAGAVMLAETARGIVLTGFPWGLQSYAWIETPAMQAAALIGAQALAAATVAAAALAGTARLRAPGPALGTLALVGGAWVWGAQRLADAPAPAADAPVIRLAQPNVGQRDKWAPENRLPIFERLLLLTEAPHDGARPALVIWPEVAVTFLFDESPDAVARSVEAAGGAALAVGSVRREGGRLYNSLLAYDAAGAPLWTYDKRHLAPFGEYVPYAWVLGALGIGTLGDGLSGFAPGEADGPFAVPGLPPVAPLICYEAIFPFHVRQAARGAGWMLQITNDSWFGDSAGPWQHLAQARARAIELGLPVARAANTGVSAMIDARGRVLTSLDLDRRGALDSPLPPPEARPTLYARTGDALWLALFGIVCAGVLVRRASVPRLSCRMR